MSLEILVLLFLLAGGAIAVAGVMLTVRADMIADRTGLGEALTGAIFLGASTSLSGSVTSVTAALSGDPDLAVSNAVGGIAVQTFFLALADLSYRRANLEHAAASTTNLFQCGLLILLLSLPLTAALLPAVVLFHVHAVSPLILVVYLFGLHASSSAHRKPMWRPEETDQTRHDLREERSRHGPGDAVLFAQFACLLLVLGCAGWLIAVTGSALSAKFGVSQTLIGALLTATTTSLPELVTTIAAVRRGALQLAVGGIIGGNTFDVLFLVMSDASYADGSIFHAADPGYLLWIALGIVMTAVLLLGLIRREKHGPANIGVESVLILLIYVFGAAASIWTQSAAG